MWSFTLFNDGPLRSEIQLLMWDSTMAIQGRGTAKGQLYSTLEKVFSSRVCALVWIGFQVIPVSHMAITIDRDEKGVILLDFWRCVFLSSLCACVWVLRSVY